jgi:hypothetical protein
MKQTLILSFILISNFCLLSKESATDVPTVNIPIVFNGFNIYFSHFLGIFLFEDKANLINEISSIPHENYQNDNNGHITYYIKYYLDTPLTQNQIQNIISLVFTTQFKNQLNSLEINYWTTYIP